jgi:hypothetical protein
MADPSNDEIDYLLSRGLLGTRRKESVLRRVLARVSPRPSAFRGRWWLWLGSGATAALAGAAVLLIALHGPGSGPAELRAKGTGGAPVIDLACLGSSAGACPRGSRVAFSLDGGGGEAGFVTAFADPVSPGERIWYLVDEPLPARAPGAGAGLRAVPRAAIVGEEHAPGRYLVTVLLTRRPVGRVEPSQAAPADVVTQAKLDLVVTP